VSRRLSPEQRALGWQAASVLLGYPDDDLMARRPALRAAVEEVPGPVGEHLARFVAELEARPVAELAAAYVDTFDHARRCCLYLTYYAYGDTRKRGLALLAFKNAYRSAGLHLIDSELPDHLAVVLEFGATADPAAAERLLTEHRAGLELLRLALVDRGSPYADVVEAVCLTLPPVGARDAEAVARLAAAGPPSEEVGLQPFAPPEYMPDPISVSPMGARR
jgi:nitrate reductase delta subunit